MMVKEDKQNKEQIYNINNALPSLFVDDLRISLRNDNMACLNFFSDTPEGKFEQTRIVAKKERLLHFIDALCKHTDYYPVAAVGDDDKKKKK